MQKDGYYGISYKVVPYNWGKDKAIGITYRTIMELEEIVRAGFSAEEIVELLKDSLNKVNR